MAVSPQTSLTPFDLSGVADVHRNLPPALLVEHALAHGEGVLSASGALVARTGKYTGRTPKDKHVVREPSSENEIWWDNNRAMDQETFAKLRAKAQAALSKKSRIYVTDTIGGADPEHQIRVRFHTEKAWHALFIRTLLIRPNHEQLAHFEPDWQVLDLCTEVCDPAVDGTQGDAVIALNFATREVIIMGTQYAGEMKKSVFTILNYLLPLKGVMSMHCSANIGEEGDVALFFGLSGTGKTTLSADPNRFLIGDDEHGWTDQGVFNFEGGCYAKCIRLSKEGEPQIWDAIKFGSVLENVVLDENRVPDYNDDSLTENTRCAYPLDYIEGAVSPSVGGHPKNIFFLTCDASGVLPPIARLSPEQAMFHFLNGYTAKVAGTEAGVKEPQKTFSTCFGAPFLPLPPKRYAELLAKKMREHGTQVWLVNTGWTGGPFGVGHRMSLSHTRALLHAALCGALASAPMREDPIFGVEVPIGCPGVPGEILDPKSTWADPEAYEKTARELAALFEENHRKFE